MPCLLRIALSLLLAAAWAAAASEVPNPGSPEAARALLYDLVARDTSLGRGGVPGAAKEVAMGEEMGGVTVLLAASELEL
jgi:hypothetical protein